MTNPLAAAMAACQSTERRVAPFYYDFRAKNPLQTTWFKELTIKELGLKLLRSAGIEAPNQLPLTKIVPQYCRHSAIDMAIKRRADKPKTAS
jgi:hypothetical protein